VFGWRDTPGDPRSQALLEQALAINRRLNDLAGTALALAELAAQHMRAGDLDKAAEFSEESVAVAKASGDSPQLAYSSHRHGLVALAQGLFGLARELFDRAQDLDRQRGDQFAVIWGDVAIAEALASSGRAQEAANRLHRVPAEVLKSNNVLSANTLAAYAVTCAALGEAERAARLVGAYRALWAAIGEPIDPESPEEKAWLQQSGIAAARDTLDQGLWEQALQLGANYTLEEGLAHARQANTTTAQPPVNASDEHL
jgi:tetratricopeptide (TPR) repeat protein